MDILIVLKGGSGSGQESVADIGISKFNCSGKVSMLDWMRGALSEEFGVPAERFSVDADVRFERPVIVRPSSLRRLMMKLGEYGLIGVNRISTGKWNGRLIPTASAMLDWFYLEMVLPNCGDNFASLITKEKGLAAIPRRLDQTYDVIFVTDVNTDAQINVLKRGVPLFFVVSVDKTDANPLAFDSIVNDGGLVDLEVKVRDMLLKVQEEVKNIKSKQPA